MVRGFDLSYINFGCPFSWEDAQTRVEIEKGFRLPNAAEAIFIDFNHQAIWVSDMIGNSNAVMDIEWGIQVVKDGSYGLILVER